MSNFGKDRISSHRRLAKVKFAGRCALSLFLLGVLFFLPLHLAASCHHGSRTENGHSLQTVSSCDRVHSHHEHEHSCPSIHEAFVVRGVLAAHSEGLLPPDIPSVECAAIPDPVLLFYETEPIAPVGISSNRIRFSLRLPLLI
jgi:hypothetical protein